MKVVQWRTLLGSVLCACIVAGGSTARTAAPVSTDAEARSMAQDYWSKALVKCGENYFLKTRYLTEGDSTLYEYKGVAFHFEAIALSETDKLNGYEWAAQSKVTYTFVRSRGVAFQRSDQQPGPWSDWTGPQFWKSPVTLQIVKRSGVVSVTAFDALGTETVNYDKGPLPTCGDYEVVN